MTIYSYHMVSDHTKHTHTHIGIRSGYAYIRKDKLARKART